MVGQHLGLVAGPLAVLGDGLQSLDDQVYIPLVDVEAQQAQAPRGAAADAVQELQRLAHQVVVGLVVLVAQEVLWVRKDKTKRLVSDFSILFFHSNNHDQDY